MTQTDPENKVQSDREEIIREQTKQSQLTMMMLLIRLNNQPCRLNEAIDELLQCRLITDVE